MEKTLERILADSKANEGNLISILQDIEEAFGYIPENAVNWFASNLDINPSVFYGIATFYAQFHLKPRGKNIITSCCGTACHVRGAERLYNTARLELKLGEDQDTTEDGEFTLEKVACLGTCSMAPVMIIGNKMQAKMTSDKVIKDIAMLRKDKK